MPTEELQEQQEQKRRELIASSGVALAGDTFAFREIESPSQRAFRRFRKHRLALFGISLLLVMAIIAIGADFLAPIGTPSKTCHAIAKAPVRRTC